jgi:hypothetical protein
MRLRAGAQGIAMGSVAAIFVFAATNFLVIKGGASVGPHLVLLSQYFIGYEVSFVGSFVGAAYGFVLGYILGHLNAGFYNLFAKTDVE